MDSKVCAKCGLIHFRCTAHNRAGKPCGRSRADGSTVCNMHGANAPQVREASKRRVQAASAERAVQTFGLPREIDPQSALLEELHRTAGVVSWLGQVVSELHRDEAKQLDMSGKFEKPSVWVEMYQQERAHYAKVAKAAIDAGIEERRVKLAEQQGELISGLIRDVLADVFALLAAAGVAAEIIRTVQREQVNQVVRARLLEIAERS